ncbi:hypothetical protein, partial [Marinobacter sp.]|uniref:hypothetical protein n=1 Tax=Marinobacter sp. TaxID=50741 RepID=UPI00263566DB
IDFISTERDFAFPVLVNALARPVGETQALPFWISIYHKNRSKLRARLLRIFILGQPSEQNAARKGRKVRHSYLQPRWAIIEV